MTTSYRLLKLLHLAALVAFLGGIAACIVLDATGHLGRSFEFLVRRRIASDLSWGLIVPGMCALVLSGLLLAWRNHAGFLPRNWLGAKQALGGLILVNGLFLIVPRLQRITALVREGNPDLALAASLQKGEDILGGLNLLFAMLALAIAVWKTRGEPQVGVRRGVK